MSETTEEDEELVIDHDFLEDFRKALDATHLSELARRTILLRYLGMVKKYKDKTSRIRKVHMTLRLVILAGGVATPMMVAAMFNPTGDGECETNASVLTALGISIMVSFSSGAMEVFGVPRQSQTLVATLRSLEREGWAFIALSGRYNKYKSHMHCWPRFMTNVEQINSASFTRSLSIKAPPSSDDAQKPGNDDGKSIADIMGTWQPGPPTNSDGISVSDSLFGAKNTNEESETRVWVDRTSESSWKSEK